MELNAMEGGYACEKSEDSTSVGDTLAQLGLQLDQAAQRAIAYMSNDPALPIPANAR